MNAEAVNDRAKLIIRRLAARALLRSTSPFPTCLPCLQDLTVRRRILRKALLG